MMLLFSAIIYVSCSLVDAIRQLLFKWCGVNKLLNYIQEKCDALQKKYLEDNQVDESIDSREVVLSNDQKIE